MTREELIEMLNILLDNAEIGCADITVIKHVSFDSFKFVLVQTIKALSQEPKTQMVDKSNFDIEQYKMDLQGAYDCGFEAGKKVEQEPCTDAVSRKDVINAIDKWITEYKPQHYLIQSIRELPSVNPQPCDDAISREVVLKKQYRIDDSATLSTRDVVNVEDIEDEPPITQKSDNKYRKEAKRWKNKWLKSQKSGKWIKVTNGRGGHECDICHEYAPSYQDGDEYLTKYCPNCGAKMESEVNNG